MPNVRQASKGVLLLMNHPSPASLIVEINTLLTMNTSDGRFLSEARPLLIRCQDELERLTAPVTEDMVERALKEYQRVMSKPYCKDRERAAIRAGLAELTPGAERWRPPKGWKLVPEEPTNEMWEAGREPILYRDSNAPPDMVQNAPWFDAERDALPRKDGHTPKGNTAVWVWRAMCDKAPPPPASED